MAAWLFLVKLSKAHCDSSYKLSCSGCLNIKEDDLLNKISSNSSSNNIISNISYILDSSSVITDDGYLAGDNKTSTIL
ncbi:hypothetical protein IFM47457_11094 [Aspergillus lentulus]|nr:hypothetical protein IFM47457_11094 [Aspergillus lentulus]